MKIRIWAAQKMVDPEIGDTLINPLGWLTDKDGGSLDCYSGPESMPETGTVVGIGEYRNGGYCVVVEVDTVPLLANAIDARDLAA